MPETKIKEIYTVHNGQVCSAPVLTQGPKTVTIAYCSEFNCRARFIKKHVCVTPKEAIKKELDEAKMAHGLAQQKMLTATKRLNKAEGLYRSAGMSKNAKEKEK